MARAKRNESCSAPIPMTLSLPSFSAKTFTASSTGLLTMTNKASGTRRQHISAICSNKARLVFPQSRRSTRFPGRDTPAQMRTISPSTSSVLATTSTSTPSSSNASIRSIRLLRSWAELQAICTFQQTTAKKVDGKHAANGTGSSDDRDTGRHAEIMRKVLPYVKGYKLWAKTSPTVLTPALGPITRGHDPDASPEDPSCGTQLLPVLSRPLR